MSFVTYAELLKGAERSTRKADVIRRLAQLTRQVPVSYPSGAEICRHYAEQFTRLRTAGTPIGANDLWIGCHALADSATLVTNKEREFRRLDGLAVENWVASA
jgi:tRNA(fMet)-specific endonuclease VapC